MKINEKTNHNTDNKLRCIVCGSNELYSELYKYKQVEKSKSLVNLRKKSNLIFTLEVPTCQECNKKLKKWTLYNRISMGIFILSLTSVITGIFILIFHQIYGDIGVLIIGLSFLFTISSLIFRYIIGKIESNPSNYLFYDFIGKVFYVKPKEEQIWIPYNLWIKTVVGK